VAASDGDPAPVAVFVAGADDGADGPPHPPSKTPASAGPANATLTMRITSGNCRDNLMSSPRHDASLFQVQPTLLQRETGRGDGRIP
jgi:hypothetical protein